VTLGLRFTAPPGSAWEYEQAFAKACKAGHPPDQWKPRKEPIRRIYNDLVSQGRRRSTYSAMKKEQQR
jgi:hypothetical protein